ncbi:DUF4124 domain-containing protein [Thioalkalivibrio thiocyanodenitrificans]|uniref:DUF4124 domain-containing protein n=1 Tax=Thioalkalivibrio thiocyanodenitrificans TaxID=243063 RepID=UPI0012E9FB03|nr:DUF4124 domain-containing protein [Thioalkalivibrio thiocyanodenitrificans]
MSCPEIIRITPFAIAALLLVMGLLPPPLTAQDTVYRWTDSQGMVHYGQAPPPGVDATPITRAAPRVDRAPQERLERAMEERDQRHEETRAEQEERERQEVSERIRAENCARARTNLEILTARGGRVTIRDNDQYRVIDEEERQTRIAATREQIQEFCRD